jgi:tripartite-type tricarboxylate transporter receptor subunit TctC
MIQARCKYRTPTMGIRTRNAAACFGALLLLAWPLAPRPANAQGYPSRPVRLIVPNAVGSPPDVSARAISQALGHSLGQPLVVDNRVGANGIIGMEACARAAPDGHTLCAPQSAAISLNPFVYAKLPYDPPRDFAPVIQIGVINAAIVAAATLPVNSLKELLELAKSRPGALNWASWGSGSFSHLYYAWLQSDSGASFTHVPYKSSDQAMTAVITGDAQVFLNATGALQTQVRARKLKALAIVGSRRSANLPGVPTFRELGFELDFRGWVGVFAPAGTARDIVMRLNAEINRILADRSMIEKVFGAAGLDPTGGTPEEFAAFLRTDRETGAMLVRLANARAG